MTPIEATLDLQAVRQVLRYDPESGHLFWTAKYGRRRLDVPAGKSCRDGYRRVGFDGRYFMAHRLAWALHYGAFPDLQLDHINRTRDDNRIINLREVSMRVNQHNKGRDKNQIGTTYLSRIRRWQAQVKIGGQPRYLGTFATQEAANRAYIRALAEAGEIA